MNTMLLIALAIMGMSVLRRILSGLKRRIFNPITRQSVRAGALFTIDGDTLALDEERIRLYGIDAPEMGQGRPGAMARDGLRAMLRGRDAIVERRGVDRYGRTLARILVEGHDLSAELVRGGLARASSFERDYVRFEKMARAERAGLWATGFPCPATWRQMQG